MKKNKILYILNSDFGGNQIGGRFKHIIDQLPKNSSYLVFTRSFKNNFKDKYNLIQVMPKGKLTMQILTAIPIYISKKINTNPLKIKLFEYFLINKLKKIDLNEFNIVHSADFLPNIFNYIKTKNSNIKIYQDVPIALPSILKNLEDVDALWKGESLNTSIYIKNSFKYIDYFLSPSNFVKDSLINENISIDKIKIIPFGVDVEKFNLNIKKNKKFKAVFVGNVNNRKGIPYLIEAWKSLNLKNAELNIYGRVYPEVKKYLVDENEYNIFTHGYTDIKNILNKNDLFLFPSLMEGSAKAIYEALACGMPVITTYNAGSIINDGKEGFIIPIQNVEKVKEKILFFYNNKDNLKSFGKNARKLAEKYTWEKYGEEVINFYKKNEK